MTGVIPNPNLPHSQQTNHSVFTITHVGAIDDNFVNSVINIVNSFQTMPTELILSISSGGGQVMHGITAYNYLKKLPCVLHTHNMGEVSSAAILPYLAGQIRTADAVSKFMFHPLTIGINAEMSYPKFQELLSMLDRDIINYAAIVEREAQQLCKTHDIMSVLKHDTLVVTAAEGHELGLLKDPVAL